MSSDAPARMTLGELLEHLDDLAQLAANEGFAYFAGACDALLERARNDARYHARRVNAPAAPASSPRE